MAMAKSRRQELLELALRDLEQHGLADLSLRPLAARIGTSARLLIFHFKSKEGLMQALLEEVQRQLQATARALPAPGTDASPVPLQLFWHWATHRDNLPRLRLLYEAHVIALQNRRRYGRYLEQTSVSWVSLIEARLSPQLRSREIATLCAAVFDGLMLELMSTGDLKRTSTALDRFVALLLKERARRR
jgi:AcrR family transcriptional regulator